MNISHLTDKKIIESFLRKDADLHFYLLADLEDPFWNYSTWYALKRESSVYALVMLYGGLSIPTLTALARENLQEHGELLESLHEYFPNRMYASISPGLISAVGSKFSLMSQGTHYKMVLKHPEAILQKAEFHCTRLTLANFEELSDFYSIHYPGSWFTRDMVATNQYYGIRESGKLVAAGGVHVRSTLYRVAALGNIVTSAPYRGHGYATAITAAICKSLLTSAELIGLNVKSDNASAITCYRKLGFEIVATYDEYSMTRL